MADLQSDLIVQDGKAYVSLDHLNTVLASVPDNPSKATIVTKVSNGRLRLSLQIQPTENAQTEGSQRSRSGHKLERDPDRDLDQHVTNVHNVVQRSGGPNLVRYGDGTIGRANHDAINDASNQNAYALVKQLKDLRLDGKTLDQLLTDPHPPQLDELDKAKGSLIHLSTANDGRVFSVLVGSNIASDRGCYWGRAYLHSREVRSVYDPVLLNDPLTPYHVEKLRIPLCLVKEREQTRCFRASVQRLWPELWERYHRLIERPIDISLIEKNLKEGNYQTIAHFMMDVDLLRLNTTRFFGPPHDMTTKANGVVDYIFSKVWDCIAEERTLKGLGNSREGQPAERCTGSVLEMVFINSRHWAMAQDVAGRSHYPQFVIPLGRVCVAQDLDSETYATRLIVVMDIASPRKAIWLLWDYYTAEPDAGPYSWLPNDQLALLDANGRRNKTLSKLVDDIDLWDIRSNDTDSGSFSLKLLPNWDEIQVPDGVTRSQVSPADVILDHTWKQRAVGTIQHGWGFGDQSEQRERRRDEQGNSPEEPAAKRLKPNKKKGAN